MSKFFKALEQAERDRAGFRWLTCLEVADRLLHDPSVDPSVLIRVADQEGVIAEAVDDPRDPTGVLRDPAEGFRREQAGVPRAGDPETGPDILRDLVSRERLDPAAQGDPLLELAQSREGQAVPELGLAHQQDLEQLVGRRLEVREESDLLERLGRQVLGLVDDQHGVEPGPASLDQEGVQRDQALSVARAGPRGAEVLQGILEEIVERKRRVEDEGGGRVAIEPPEQRVDERGLAAADLARQDEKPLLFLDPIDELGEGLAVARGQDEEARVRRHAERLFLEPVKREVHVRLSLS